MHELGEARKLFNDAIEMKGDRNLKRIVIVLGEASGIKESFLRHSFEEHIFPDYNLTGTMIDVRIEKPKLRCDDCGYEMDDVTGMTCEKCGSFNISIAGGDRVYVAEVE